MASKTGLSCSRASANGASPHARHLIWSALFGRGEKWKSLMRADFYRGWVDAPRIEGSMFEVDIRPVGDAAVLAVLGNSIDQALVNGVWSLADEVRRSRCAGMLDVVPAYASVLVRFDPFVADLPRIMAVVRGAAERAADAASPRLRRLTISVCFGGECGIDFETVAHELGMREARLRDAFCKPEYR